jgi:hypothetical protein
LGRKQIDITDYTTNTKMADSEEGPTNVDGDSTKATTTSTTPSAEETEKITQAILEQLRLQSLVGPSGGGGGASASMEDRRHAFWDTQVGRRHLFLFVGEVGGVER